MSRLATAGVCTALLLLQLAFAASGDITVQFGHEDTLFAASDSGFAKVLALMEVLGEKDARPCATPADGSDSKDYVRHIRGAVSTISTVRPVPLSDDLYGQRDDDLASVDLELRSLALACPSDPIPHYYRGIVAIERGELELAPPHLERARMLGQRDLRVTRLLVALYSEKPELALEVARSAPEHRSDEFLLMREVVILASLGRLEEAIQTCRSWVERSESRDARTLLASLQLVAERYSEAEADLEILRREGPGQKQVLSLLLQALRLQGKTSEARAVGEELRSAYPDDPGIQELLSGSAKAIAH